MVTYTALSTHNIRIIKNPQTKQTDMAPSIPCSQLIVNHTICSLRPVYCNHYHSHLKKNQTTMCTLFIRMKSRC